MDDSISQVLTVMSHDDLVCVTTMGRAFKISAYDIPECSRTALGAPLPELIPKMGRDVSLAAILPLRTYDASESLVLMTKGGRVKRIALSDLQCAPRPLPARHCAACGTVSLWACLPAVAQGASTPFKVKP